MVRGFYSVVNRIREDYSSLNRVIRCPTVQGYLGPRKFSVQINVSFKTGKFLSKWGKLVFLGSSNSAVERGWLQSKDLKATNKKDTPCTSAHSGTEAITQNQESGIQE